MFNHRRPILCTLVLALAAGLAACDDSAHLTEPEGADLTTPSFAASENAATTVRGTFTSPFPPNPNIESIPVLAPCLGLDEPPRASGTWSGWFQVVQTSTGHVHVTEKIDYSEVSITAGDLTWTAGPGAYESIIQNVPATVDDLGESAYNIKHEFHARYLSEDGLADLRVTHRAIQVLGPDLELRQNEFVPFTAECIGGGG